MQLEEIRDEVRLSCVMDRRDGELEFVGELSTCVVRRGREATGQAYTNEGVKVDGLYNQLDLWKAATREHIPRSSAPRAT